jgi:hypothetical protein
MVSLVMKLNGRIQERSRISFETASFVKVRCGGTGTETPCGYPFIHKNMCRSKKGEENADKKCNGQGI